MKKLKTHIKHKIALKAYFWLENIKNICYLAYLRIRIKLQITLLCHSVTPRSILCTKKLKIDSKA